MTTQHLTQRVASATRPRRSRPLGRVYSDGRFAVRFAQNCWSEPSLWLGVEAFQTLPLWQQQQLVSCVAFIRRGWIRFDPELLKAI
jgi:hypothetical protein